MPPKIPYKQVKINLKEDESKRLKAIAKGRGISITELFRQSVGTEIPNARQPKVERIFKAPNPYMLYLFKSISDNINQMSRHANIHKTLDRVVMCGLSDVQKELEMLL